MSSRVSMSLAARWSAPCGALLLAACSATANRPAPPRVAGPAFEASRAEARPVEAKPAEAEPAEAQPVAVAPAPKGAPPVEAAPAAAAEAPSAGKSAGASTGTSTGTSVPADLAVATVAGTRIELAELLGSWLRRDGAGMRELLDDLVLSRIVELEAARFGATLPRGTVERTLERRRAALEAEAQKAGAPDLDTFLRRRLMLTQEEFFGGLAREIAVDLLASRVVRAWLLTTEHAAVRVIAVSTPEARDRAAAKLAAGTPFGDVAQELSEDESREQGGRVPPVVRSDSPLARLAFVTPAGEVAGPFEQGGKWLFLRVDARPKPLAGGWDTLGEAVEQSLSARPIEDPEYWQWQAAMDALYEVDLAPFRTLLRGAR